MSSPSPQKLALSRDRILTEAIAVADSHGVERLSMRKLAQRLGVGPMSLYRHVANKDDMIDAMLDVVCENIELPQVDAPWRNAVLTSSTSAHEVLLEHPWAATEWAKRRPGPARLAYAEALLAVLTAAGLRPELVYHGYHAITLHIVGFTTQALGYQAMLGDADLEDLAAAFLAELPGPFPHMAEHVRAHLADDHGSEFTFALDLITEGLDRANRG